MTRRFGLDPKVWSGLILIIPALLLTTTGEIFLKQAMNQIGHFEFQLDAILAVLPRLLTHPLMWLGGLGFVVGSVFWLGVLSRAPLSLAYPILALSYFIIVVESWLFLGEKVTWMRVAGVAIIYVGVIIVGLSEGPQK